MKRMPAKSIQHPFPRRRRHGFLLFDLVFGVAALAVILTGTLAVIAGLKNQDLINHQHFLANQHLANVAEEIDTLENADDVNVTLPDDIKTDLPGAKLKIAAQPAAFRSAHAPNATSGGATTQITCTLTWNPSNAKRPQQATLTVWKLAPLKQPDANGAAE